MVNKINTLMSYPHREIPVQYKKTKKGEDRGFKAILDECIKELKRKGDKESGS